jgi:hypothetical protein
MQCFDQKAVSSQGDEGQPKFNIFAGSADVMLPVERQS